MVNRSCVPALITGLWNISFTNLYRIAKILSLKNTPGWSILMTLFYSAQHVRWYDFKLSSSLFCFSPLTLSTYYLSVISGTFCHLLFNVKRFMSRAILCCQVSSCYSNTWQETHDTWNRRAPLHRVSDIPLHWKDWDEPDCWCVFVYLSL